MVAQSKEAALSLDLDILRGGAADMPLVLSARSLTPSDLEDWRELGPKEPVRFTERMRTIHHSIARMEATGVKHVDISRITGYSQVTLSTLQRNPAFQDLVAHYGVKADAAASDMTDRLYHLALDAVDRLHERVLDEDTAISVKELRGIITDLADRTGHAPVQRSERLHLHVGLTKEELEEAKRASKQWNGNGGAAAPAPERAVEAAETGERSAPRGATGSGSIQLLAAIAGLETRGPEI